MSADSVWFASLNPTERQELTAATIGDVPTKPDLLVVGAGLVGLATAHYAAERGVRVVVIDAGDIAAGASGANAGGVCASVDGLDYPEPFGTLAAASRDLWGRLTVRPGFDFDWRVTGFLQVDSSRFPAAAPEYATKAQEAGFTVQAVDAEQLALLEPQLARRLRAGLLFPSEAQLHPVKAALSFARRIRAKGGVVRSHLAARQIERSNDRVVAVQTDAGRIEPKQVVITTGWRGDWLADIVPKWPIQSVSGQMLATEPLPKLIARPIGAEFVVSQLKSGEIITGGDETPGSSTQVDAAQAEQMIAAARTLIPALAETPFVRRWRGVRPRTADGLPVVARLPGFENLYVNCGHFKKGVLLAPVTGKLLADWLVDGIRPEELSGLEWDRPALSE
jgi:glycine oxidase